jgi:hypothetical protein
MSVLKKKNDPQIIRVLPARDTSRNRCPIRAKDGEGRASAVEPIFGDLIKVLHMKALTKLLAKMPAGAPGAESEDQFFQK